MRILFSMLFLLTACTIYDPQEVLKNKRRSPAAISELSLICYKEGPFLTIKKPMKQLSAAIGQFINLKKLDLRYNELTTLPLEFGNLKTWKN